MPRTANTMAQVMIIIIFNPPRKFWPLWISFSHFTTEVDKEKQPQVEGSGSKYTINFAPCCVLSLNAERVDELSINS